MSLIPDPDDPCAGNPECQQALAEIYAYLDGELTIERTTILKTHFHDCPPCGDRVTFEAELRQVVSVRCQDRVPEALKAKIADALRKELGG
ncbi:MAG: mycothiol system anti-sigma-R factor [Actinomycetota bacterium]